MTAVGDSLNTESTFSLINGVPGKVSFSVLLLAVAKRGYLLL